MGKVQMLCDCDLIHKDLVNKAKKNMLSDDVLLKMAEFYKVLSDNTRIKIINALNMCSLCVCDIATILNMTKSAVSHQLRYLREMGIVKFEKKGKEVIYNLNDRHVEQIFEITKTHMEVCCHEN